MNLSSLKVLPMNSWCLIWREWLSFATKKQQHQQKKQQNYMLEISLSKIQR